MFVELIWLAIDAFYKIDDVLIALKQLRIIAFPMGKGAVRAVLDPVFGIGAVAAAFSAQRIKRAIAEQTIELVLRDVCVAGKVFALPILKKTVMLGFFHGRRLLWANQTPAERRYSARPVS